MRPRPADGEFSQIGQGLADGRSEQEGAHRLVDRRHVLVEVGVGVELLAVDQINFPGGDLREHGRVGDTSAAPGGRKEGREGATYDDDRAGDGDDRQRDVGDGVGFEGVFDALVVAVDASLIGPVHDVHDDEGERRCTTERVESYDG